MKHIKSCGIVAIAVLASIAPVVAQAHHSHAMFDPTKTVEVQGTVKAFNFANPHVFLFLVGTGQDGAPVTYPVEMSFIQNMMRQGMKASTFKAGDKVTVSFNPYRDGRMGGSYRGAVDSRGMKYGSLNPDTAQPARGAE